MCRKGVDMMKLSEDKITKFVDEEGFTIYIEEKEDEFVAYIGHDNYGIIELIYGVPKVQPNTGDAETFKSFTDGIMSNIIEHKYFYTKRYIMEEDNL